MAIVVDAFEADENGNVETFRGIRNLPYYCIIIIIFFLFFFGN
jgi:hypothetical protein